MDIMGPEDFEKLGLYIYRRSGIWVGDDKHYFLESRVLSRMDAMAMDRFTDYFRFLVLDPEGEEFRQLINCVTINETYFFRDYNQLVGFAEKVLPIIIAKKREVGDRTLHLLSAGCSTGEETYSLAIILREMLPDFEEWVVRIDGIDINTEVLDHARRAHYGTRSTRDVPITFRLRWFDEAPDGLSVKPTIRNMVRFEYGNLYDPRYMAKFSGVDVIFCRNVFIYFDDESRTRVLSNFYNLLKPEGFIFMGYAESVSRYSGAFEVVRLGDLITHRKPPVPMRAER